MTVAAEMPPACLTAALANGEVMADDLARADKKARRNILRS
jgi:hypothetical protein